MLRQKEWRFEGMKPVAQGRSLGEHSIERACQCSVMQYIYAIESREVPHQLGHVAIGAPTDGRCLFAW